MSWLFGASSAKGREADPSASSPQASARGSDACPVDHTTRARWLLQQNQQSGPASSGASPHPFSGPPARSPGASAFAASPSSLSLERETSSIPRYSAEAAGADSATPTGTKWVYPSPSQFYTALQRKNRNPRQEDMDIVVPIHNAVNERTWDEVMKWENEALSGAAAKDAVQLVSFKGRPNDRTPRAWWKILLGYQPPFDRHDWTIDRNGKRIRYVIDFYTGRGGAGAGAGAGLPPQLAFYLDVRPALDNFEGVKMRVRRSLNKLFGLGSPSHQHLTGNSDRSTVQRVNS